MEVRVVSTDQLGTIRRKLMRDGAHVGYWVQVQVVNGGDNGQRPFTFDQLDPADGGKAKASQKPASDKDWLGRTNLPATIMEDGSMRTPPRFRELSGSAPEDTILAGEGVQFRDTLGLWHDGYCTEIEDGHYTVYIADKLIKEHIGWPSVTVDRARVRSSADIRARLGRKKTKSSKRDWSATKLATHDEQRQVAGMHSAIAPLLLRNPVLFGQLLRTGGHVGSEEFLDVAKSLGIDVTLKTSTRGKSKNKTTSNAIVANDTAALLATRLDDLKKGPGEWLLHGKTPANEEDSNSEEGGKDAMEDLGVEKPENEDVCPYPTMTESELRNLREVDLASFRQRFIFQQGGIANEKVKLPKGDRRTKMHAEAKAVRSPTWDNILKQTIAEFRRPSSSEHLPARRKIISIAINRSSCGTKKESGHTGGCAGELAVALRDFWTALSDALSADYVAELRSGGRIVVEVSVGGEYEKPGETGPMTAAGATLRTHPTYDYAANMPEPMTTRKYDYMKRLGGGDESPKTSSELMKLLAQIQAAYAPETNPTNHVESERGQHQIRGRTHTGQTGRIACTSIAALALQRILAHPGPVNAGQVGARDLDDVMASGTDLDRELRDSLMPQPMLTENSGSDSSALEPIVTARDQTSATHETGSSTFGEISTSGIGKDMEVEELTSAKNPKSGADDIENRYFAHDEIDGRIPGLEVHQDALDEVEEGYLYGVRGDYRRIARQLVRMGTGTGLLVTIGAATITVANITPESGVLSLALFDSHGRAVLETYASEEDLADGVEALYPALPGVGEMHGVWYATPYRPTPRDNL